MKRPAKVTAKRPKPPATTFGKRFYPTPIERKAEEVIDACLAKLGLTAPPLPIPVDAWIEGPLGIDFGIEDLSPLGPDVLGAAYLQQRRMVISERIAAREERFRFTCAHELGHFILHGRLKLAFRDTTDEPGRTDLHEREADRFAAAFLMPMTAVVDLLLEISRAQQLHPLALRSQLLADGDSPSPLVTDTLVPAIQKRFRVSMSAALFRLREVILPEIGPFMSAVRPPVITLK